MIHIIKTGMPALCAGNRLQAKCFSSIMLPAATTHIMMLLIYCLCIMHCLQCDAHALETLSETAALNVDHASDPHTDVLG